MVTFWRTFEKTDGRNFTNSTRTRIHLEGGVDSYTLCGMDIVGDSLIYAKDPKKLTGSHRVTCEDCQHIIQIVNEYILNNKKGDIMDLSNKNWKVSELDYRCVVGDDGLVIADIRSYNKIDAAAIAQVPQLLKLAQELSKSTCAWSNRGLTELAAKADAILIKIKEA